MSILKVNTLQDATGGNASTAEQIAQGRAKAWVIFNGTFGTSPFTEANGGIRNSFNVSSVTDNGTGDYTVTFTNSFSSTNYLAVPSAIFTTAGNAVSVVMGNGSVGGRVVGSCRFLTVQGTTQFDSDNIGVSFFGD